MMPSNLEINLGEAQRYQRAPATIRRQLISTAPRLAAIAAPALTPMLSGSAPCKSDLNLVFQPVIDLADNNNYDRLPWPRRIQRPLARIEAA